MTRELFSYEAGTRHSHECSGCTGYFGCEKACSLHYEKPLCRDCLFGVIKTPPRMNISPAQRIVRKS